MLSVAGKRVLHVDRNNYYGAEAASLALNNLYERFRGDASGIPKEYGRPQDWAVDLIPKLIMADGSLTKILLHSKVTRYLQFRSIDGSFVYTNDDGGWLSKSDKIEKVPTTPAEALSSGLMGMFEKRKFRNFLLFMDTYDPKDPSTLLQGKTLDNYTCRELFTYYDLDPNTQGFIAHAMMLFTDDDYLDWTANVAADALKLYMDSMQRYPPHTSPYIYPLYGLGGLPEGFSRLCAINGGTFMLNRGIDEILTGPDGKAWGVKADNTVAKAKIFVGDPSYFKSEMSEKVGQVARSICILNHPIPNTNDAESAQIILPARQLNRKNDVYICMVSSAHDVCAQGFYIAIVSTLVETATPMEELATAIRLLGPVSERFDTVADMMAPTNNGLDDNCFMSKSYDAASHFESTANDVLELYERITGEKLDMSIEPELDDM